MQLEHVNRPSLKTAYFVARIGAILSFVIAMIAMEGWLFHQSLLAGIFPPLSSMRFNTAVAMACSAVALLLIHPFPTPRKRAIGGLLLGSFALLVGALTLAEYLFQIDLRIDELFVKVPPGSSEALIPARMGPNTAYCLTCCAAAIVCISLGRSGGIRAAQVFAFFSAFLAFTALMGYAYGASAFYGISSYTRMALNTTLGMLFLSVSILGLRPTSHLMAVLTSEGAGGLMLRRLLPIAILVPIVFGWLRLKGQIAGYYGLEFGTAILTTVSVLVFTVIAWRTATVLQAANTELRRWEEIFRNASWGVCLADAATFRVILANSSLTKMHGYDAGELVGQPLTSLFSPERMSETERHLATVTDHGHDTFESVHVCKDGSTIPVLVEMVAVPDNTGRPLYIAANFQDISERKRRELDIRESERRLRQLADSMPQIVWMARPDGTVDYFNERWYEFSGFDRERAVGDGWENILHSDDVEKSIKTWHEAVRSGKPYEIQHRFLDRNRGGYRWFLGRALPVCNATGEIVRWYGTWTDIDAQKRAEQEEQHMRAELELALRELDAFSYTVSHDLRAPLRAIDAFLGMIEEDVADVLSEESRHHFNMVRENSVKMNALITGLLAFARLSRQPLARQRVNTSHVAIQARDMVLADVAGGRPEIQISPLPDLDADPLLLLQVFTNLLSNAVKYSSGRSAPLIEVGCEPRDDQDIIFVRDNGVGFRMEYAHRLFGVFQRLHHEHEFEGTGVGLAIVHRIITRHGGNIWATSELDKGACFYFSMGTEQRKELSSPVTFASEVFAKSAT